MVFQQLLYGFDDSVSGQRLLQFLQCPSFAGEIDIDWWIQELSFHLLYNVLLVRIGVEVTFSQSTHSSLDVECLIGIFSEKVNLVVSAYEVWLDFDQAPNSSQNDVNLQLEESSLKVVIFFQPTFNSMLFATRQFSEPLLDPLPPYQVSWTVRPLQAVKDGFPMFALSAYLFNIFKKSHMFASPSLMSLT